LAALADALADQPSNQAGVRLYGVERLRRFLEARGPLGALAASVMAGSPRPVRALLFDKTVGTNWSLPWHQDRVIAVRERIEVWGFGPWTRKQGALHVTPPIGILERMTTLRLHLDPVPSTNAPLLIAPGSHLLGRIPESEVPAVVDRCGVLACLASLGDAWLYSTPILHASEAALEPARRRVLQVDYAAEDLPGGLCWLGV
jgi:Phytanoyl-CoA dioxygenase (PhyH)